MAKFIELHHEGVPALVNLDHIAQVNVHNLSDYDHAELLYEDDTVFRSDETYEEVRTKIARAQGSLPRF